MKNSKLIRFCLTIVSCAILLIFNDLSTLAITSNGYPKYQSLNNNLSKPLLYSYNNLSQRSIEIIGDNRFTRQVWTALDLLFSRDSEAFQFSQRYIGRIEQSNRSGMVVHVNPPTFQLSDRTAYSSITWLASVIAHEAYHSYLYQYYSWHMGVENVPYDLWGGVEAERQCNAFQLGVLQRVGAPSHEVENLRQQNGTHGDVNRDGILDWNDYYWRNW